MVEPGAPAALHGYRLQMLYTLGRVLSASSCPSTVFHLEGWEDLDVLDGDTFQEVVQVKASPNLSLSDLRPQRDGSFLRRALAFRSSPSAPRIALVNFCSFGAELENAWRGELASQSRVRTRLLDHGYSDEEIGYLFANVVLKTVDEQETLLAVQAKLREMPVGADPEAAAEFLMSWLYRSAEKRASVTTSDLAHKVNAVARFITDRRTYHQEWGTVITPLGDMAARDAQRTTLEREFREGASARYEHILADLDFLREDRLTAIHEAFARNSVVVLHGVSGQGKTTLGYRYLHEYWPKDLCFVIQVVRDREHALAIARALAGYAGAMGLEMAIYIDVSPGESEWPELVRQLAHLRQFHVLVTIREEDFARATLSRADFGYEDVELSLSPDEAKMLFARAMEAGQVEEFLDFEGAWARFGEHGPLLEFVYVLTHATTLRARLQQQVTRIRDDVALGTAAGDELLVLRLVAIASEHGARLDLARMRRALAIQDLERTVSLLEREYFVRLTPDGRYVAGVHPVRSAILVSLLTDPSTEPWSEAAETVLPVVVEEDLETFLFGAFVSRPSDFAFRDATTAYYPTTWSGCGAVARSLLWCGVRDYVAANKDTFNEAFELFGPGWLYVLDTDLTGLLSEDTDPWWEKLALLPEEAQQRIRDLRVGQTPKEDVFNLLAAWIADWPGTRQRPSSARDWNGVSFLLFWANRLDVGPSVEQSIKDEDLVESVDRLDLQSLSRLSSALHASSPGRYSGWLAVTKSLLLSRLATEYGIVGLQEGDGLLTIHFLPSQFDQSISKHPDLHDQTMERVHLVRRLFPQYAGYGSQAYGHRWTGLSSRLDPSTKTAIPVKMLPLDRAVEPNSWLHGLSSYAQRPRTWEDYVQTTLAIRRAVADGVAAIRRSSERFQRSDAAINIASEGGTHAAWQKARQAVDGGQLLPQAAVDPWGYVFEARQRNPSATAFEGGQKNPSGNDPLVGPTLRAFAVHRYKSYLDAWRAYTVALRGFLEQGQHVALSNYADRRSRTRVQRALMLQLLEKEGISTGLQHHSTYNLFEAYLTLPLYQEQFRALFVSMVDRSELEQIEHTEEQALATLWPMWYFYAREPARPWADPVRQTAAKLRHERESVLADVRNAVSAVVGVRVEVLPQGPRWDGDPTLYVRMDVDHASNVYDAAGQLIERLQQALSVQSLRDLRQYVIRLYYEYTALIPTIRGHMLDGHVWRFNTLGVLAREPEFEGSQWLYQPVPLPDDVRDELGLSMWQSDMIAKAQELRFSLALAGIAAEVVYDLTSVPALTEPGGELLKKRVVEQISSLLAALETALAALDALTAAHETPQGEFEGMETFPFAKAVEALREFSDVLISEKDGLCQSASELDTEYVAALRDGLAQVYEIAQSVGLAYIDRALGPL